MVYGKAPTSSRWGILYFFTLFFCAFVPVFNTGQTQGFAPTFFPPLRTGCSRTATALSYPFFLLPSAFILYLLSITLQIVSENFLTAILQIVQAIYGCILHQCSYS